MIFFELLGRRKTSPPQPGFRAEEARNVPMVSRHSDFNLRAEPSVFLSEFFLKGNLARTQLGFSRRESSLHEFGTPA